MNFGIESARARPWDLAQHMILQNHRVQVIKFNVIASNFRDFSVFLSNPIKFVFSLWPKWCFYNSYLSKDLKAKEELLCLFPMVIAHASLKVLKGV